MSGKVPPATSAEIDQAEKLLRAPHPCERRVIAAARLALELIPFARSRVKVLTCECDDEGPACELCQLTRILAQVEDEPSPGKLVAPPWLTPFVPMPERRRDCMVCRREAGEHAHWCSFGKAGGK